MNLFSCRAFTDFSVWFFSYVLYFINFDCSNAHCISFDSHLFQLTVLKSPWNPPGFINLSFHFFVHNFISLFHFDPEWFEHEILSHSKSVKFIFIFKNFLINSASQFSRFYKFCYRTFKFNIFLGDVSFKDKILWKVAFAHVKSLPYNSVQSSV